MKATRLIIYVIMLMICFSADCQAQNVITRPSKKTKTEKPVKNTKRNQQNSRQTVGNSQKEATEIKENKSEPKKEAELCVRDFKSLPDDLTALMPETKCIDLNGKVCALIKISTDLDYNQLSFDSKYGIIKVLRKNDEIWLYIPPRSQYLDIKYGHYPRLRYYYYEEIESGKTYTMELLLNQP